jgi:GTPase SAR1 family protein
MNFKRALEGEINRHLGKNKVLVITGSRRVGKTFLINRIIQEYKNPVVQLLGELPLLGPIIACILFDSSEIPVFRGIRFVL